MSEHANSVEGRSPEPVAGRRTLPAAAELVGRVGWLIRLRWVAVVGVVAFLELARRVFSAHLALPEIYAVVGALALYNAVLALALRRFRRGAWPTPPHWSGWLARFLLPRTALGLEGERETVAAGLFANGQIALDLLFLALLLHYSGGIENPFLVFFIFHVIIASILLSRRATYVHAVFGFLLIAGIALGEAAGVLRHYPLDGLWPAGAFAEPKLVGAQLLVLGITLLLSAYMGSTIAAHLRQRERDVVLLCGRLVDESEKLEAAYQRLAEVERAKSQYMRKVAHELRGPLGTVETTLRVVTDGTAGELPGKARELLERSAGRVGELARMTRDLLTLSQARDAGGAQRTQAVSLAQLVDDLVAEFRPVAERTRVSLVCSLGVASPIVHGDPDGLGELVRNLLENALRYTPAGGRVVVTLEVEGERLWLVVEDSGVGIPEGDLPHVFEEFYRGGPARELVAQGTGLGLAIVKAVADRHGAILRLSSAVGKGTRIEVGFAELPSSPAADEAEPDRTSTTRT